MKEMFEASVDGQPYDTERWGQYFRPAGVTAPTGGSAPAVSHDEDVSVAKTIPVPVASAFDDEPAVASAPVQATAPAAGANKAEDILAMIRARQQK
jgi:hypothetical protein